MTGRVSGHVPCAWHGMSSEHQLCVHQLIGSAHRSLFSSRKLCESVLSGNTRLIAMRFRLGAGSRQHLENESVSTQRDSVVSFSSGSCMCSFLCSLRRISLGSGHLITRLSQRGRGEGCSVVLGGKYFFFIRLQDLMLPGEKVPLNFPLAAGRERI